MERADELSLDTLRGMIDHTLASGPVDVRFLDLYIFGSFGAKSATDTSDVDVLVTVPDETERETVEDATALFRHGTHELDGVSLDVVVKTEQQAASYLQQACQMRDYETVFDMHRRDYVDPSSLS